jgi:hypothetical protein
VGSCVWVDCTISEEGEFNDEKGYGGRDVIDMHSHSRRDLSFRIESLSHVH